MKNFFTCVCFWSFFFWKKWIFPILLPAVDSLYYHSSSHSDPLSGNRTTTLATIMTPDKITHLWQNFPAFWKKNQSLKKKSDIGNKSLTFGKIPWFLEKKISQWNKMSGSGINSLAFGKKIPGVVEPKYH